MSSDAEKLSRYHFTYFFFSNMYVGSKLPEYCSSILSTKWFVGVIPISNSRCKPRKKRIFSARGGNNCSSGALERSEPSGSVESYWFEEVSPQETLTLR